VSAVPDPGHARHGVHRPAFHLDVLTFFPNEYRHGLKIRKEGYRWRRAKIVRGG
jgi:hypothetical protein